jgi:hypothetical protein
MAHDEEKMTYPGSAPTGAVGYLLYPEVPLEGAYPEP